MDVSLQTVNILYFIKAEELLELDRHSQNIVSNTTDGVASTDIDMFLMAAPDVVLLKTMQPTSECATEKQNAMDFLTCTIPLRK